LWRLSECKTLISARLDETGVDFNQPAATIWDELTSQIGEVVGDTIGETVIHTKFVDRQRW